MNTAPASAPTSASAQLPVSSGITLRSGKELSVASVDRLCRRLDAIIVVLVGPPDSGKTTLISVIYELVRAAQIPGWIFAGSQTLLAFEERCHLSRVASELEEPATERSKYSEEQAFYHLRTRLESSPQTLRELFLLDVAGEGFRELHTSHEACRRLDALQRADFLAVLLDGKRLKAPRTRYLAVEECINFLQCAKGSDAISDDCEVQIIVSKSDELSTVHDAALLRETEEQLRQRLADLYPKLLFSVIAARPSNSSPVENAHGVPEILMKWTTPRQSAPVGLVQTDTGLFTRESDSFRIRLVANASHER